MRGIIFDGEKASATDRLEMRDPGPGEIAVRVSAAGVCHSDLSVIDGTIEWPAPAVLGHEGAGRLLRDELVTRTYPLEEFERAFEDLRAGRLARGVLTFD